MRCGIQQSSTDCVGKIFGDLTVDSVSRQKGETWADCLCICGTKKCIKLTEVKTGNTKSCGCRRKLPVNAKNRALAESFEGHKFNKLTIGKVFRIGARAYANCRCECGSTKKIHVYCVTSGKTKSCGCNRGKERSAWMSSYIGVKRNKLVAVSIIDENNNRLFSCLCECGQYCEVVPNLFKKGKQVSCGCSPRGTPVGRTLSPLPPVGHIFGHRTVIKHSKTEGGQAALIVKCQCGKINTISHSKYLSGRAGRCKSCAIIYKGSGRPFVGEKFGHRIVLDNSLWTTPSEGRRKSACLVRCDCGTKSVVGVNSLRQGKTSCKECGLIRSATHLKTTAKQSITARINIGHTLMLKASQADNKAKNRQILLEWALWASSVKGNNSHPAYGTTSHYKPLVQLGKAQLDLLIPLDINTPCVWPWDDHGKPLPLDKHGKLKKTKAGKNAGKKPK